MDKKPTKRVASVAAFRPDGKLLFGRRLDSGKWTLPGGHVEEGETPVHAALRELLEESNLKATELEYLGNETIVRPHKHRKNIKVFVFKAKVDGKVSGKNDPDKECEEFCWVDPEKVPESILDNLHARKNVTLRKLGIVDYKRDMKKSEESFDDLEKSTPAGFHNIFEELQPKYYENGRLLEEFFRGLGNDDYDVKVSTHPNAVEHFRNAPLVIHFPIRAIEGMLENGRMMNLLETGHGIGEREPNTRMRWEYQALGLDRTVPAHERPLYGALHWGYNADNKGLGAARAYGHSWLELKPEVKLRSTVTYSDSSLSSFNPNPHRDTYLATDPVVPYVFAHNPIKKVGSRPDYRVGHLGPHRLERVRYLKSIVGKHGYYPRNNAIDYMEAQIHGGIYLPRDVQAIHLGPSGKSAEHIEALKKFNLPIYDWELHPKNENATYPKLLWAPEGNGQRSSIVTDEDLAKRKAIRGEPTWKDTLHKFEGDLAQYLRNLRKTFHPRHFKGIAQATDTKANDVVDVAPELEVVPHNHEGSLARFKDMQTSKKSWQPDHEDVGGYTRKRVFQNDNGDKYLIKPYHEKFPSEFRNLLTHYPLGGWAEMTNQELYKAAGIPHLHQAVHVANQTAPDGNTIPMLVVHMEDNAHPVFYGRNKPNKDARKNVRKIALMDFLSHNTDRHSGNLLINKRGDPIAIDHSLSYQYGIPAALFGANKTQVRDFRRENGGYLEDMPRGYLQGGISAVDPFNNYIDVRDKTNYNYDMDRLHRYEPIIDWWGQVGPDVRKAFESRLQLIKDPDAQAHLRRNFNTRADLLDQMHDLGLDNFGTGWHNTAIPIYSPGEKTPEEEEEEEYARIRAENGW